MTKKAFVQTDQRIRVSECIWSYRRADYFCTPAS